MHPVVAVRRIGTLAIALVVILSGGPFALAEEGKLRLLRSYVRDYTTIDHAGAQIIGGSLTGTSTVLWSNAEPFVATEHAIVACIVHARTSENGIDLDSSCTMTDDDGDRLYNISRRRSGDLQEGGGGRGRTELIGGTGKYAGIVGVCSYDTVYLPDDRIVSDIDCTWRRTTE